MSEILSQSEIEALLASLNMEDSSNTPAPTRGGGGGTPSAMPSYTNTTRMDRGVINYEAYDFRRPDKFSKDQIRTFHMLHETFARHYASALSAYLRVPVHVDLVSVEQTPYDEFMRSLTHSVINVFSMAPLSGQAIAEMEMNILFSMLDRLLGGPGTSTKTGNILTDIERVLTEGIVNRALTCLQTAWEGVAQFTPKRERLETQSQFVQIVPPNDVVVFILFEIKVGEARGAMSICIPYLVLKPITSKLSSQRWFASNSRRSAGKYAPILAKRLEKTSVTCAVRLGRAKTSINEVLEWKKGDVILLDKRHKDDIEVLIGNRIKFMGKPGIRGKKVAIHVSRVTPEHESTEIKIRNAELFDEAN
jgi:flagellar motor switch protein FliM